MYKKTYIYNRLSFVHLEKFCSRSDTVKRVIQILVMRHISTVYFDEDNSLSSSKYPRHTDDTWHTDDAWHTDDTWHTVTQSLWHMTHCDAVTVTRMITVCPFGSFIEDIKLELLFIAIKLCLRSVKNYIFMFTSRFFPCNLLCFCLIFFLWLRRHLGVSKYPLKCVNLLGFQWLV